VSGIDADPRGTVSAAGTGAAGTGAAGTGAAPATGGTPGTAPGPGPASTPASGPGPARLTVRRSVTIHDVARRAGVGRQTVSNVLNGGGRVGAAARERVLDAVEALGYQPHHGARSLRSRRTMQLAYLMPRIQLRPSNLIMLQFLQALVTAAAHREYSVMVVAPEHDPLEDIRRMVASRSVDAFILSELQPGDPRVQLLADSGVAFACFGRTRGQLPQHWVDIDNRAGSDAATQHLLDRGVTRLAYVGYRSELYWDTDRTAGFRDAVARHAAGPAGPAGPAGAAAPATEPPVLLVHEDDEEAARGQVRALISATAPAGIVAGSDQLATIVYSAAADLGLGIGRELSVTGFDGSFIASLLSPRLTTVAIPVADIAGRLIDRALGQFGHGPDASPGELVPAGLQLGAST
jgi:DNA-binding LacI/PurR family transcriptional regulator